MDQGQFLSGLTHTAMDRLVGWRRKATRRGLTRTPNRPGDVYFPRACRPPEHAACGVRALPRRCL